MKILSCAFNMDTACVELKMADGIGCHLVLTNGICIAREQFFLLVRHGGLEIFFIPADQLQ